MTANERGRHKDELDHALRHGLAVTLRSLYAAGYPCYVVRGYDDMSIAGQGGRDGEDG